MPEAPPAEPSATTTAENRPDSPSSPPGQRGWWRAARARWWSRWAIDLALVGALFAVILAWQTRHLVDDGAPAPATELVDLDGASWSLSDARGRKVLLVFWAPWCGVCRAEMGTLTKLHAQADDDYEVVTVVLAYEDLDEVRDFVAERALSFPVLVGTDETAAAWSVESFPTVYVVDEEGRIEHGVVGYTTEAGLRARLAW